MTTTKTKNGKPATSANKARGLLPGRSNPPASGRRSAAAGSRGLLGRARATFPGVKRNTKKSGPQKLVAALGQATSRTTAHKPSNKSMVGILVGGVGAAAMARRRNTPEQPDLPASKPAQPEQALEANIPLSDRETTTESTPTTGGDRGDPQGPDPAAAA